MSLALDRAGAGLAYRGPTLSGLDLTWTAFMGLPAQPHPTCLFGLPDLSSSKGDGGPSFLPPEHAYRLSPGAILSSLLPHIRFLYPPTVDLSHHAHVRHFAGCQRLPRPQNNPSSIEMLPRQVQNHNPNMISQPHRDQVNYAYGMILF